MDYLKTLQQSALFKEVAAAELKKLASLSSERRLGAQEELFAEGSSGDAMYVIALGSVKVFKRDKNGDDEQVALLGTGSHFGEMALVSDDHRRVATVVAQEPTTLVCISRAGIEQACQDSPVLAWQFYRALAQSLARRLNATTADVANYRSAWKNFHRE